MTLHKLHQFWYEVLQDGEPVASISRGGDDNWRVYDQDKHEILGPYYCMKAAFEDYKGMMRRKGATTFG